MIRLSVRPRYLIITDPSGAGWVQAFPCTITDSDALAYVLNWINPEPGWDARFTDHKPWSLGTNPETWNPAGWIWNHAALALIIAGLACRLHRTGCRS